MISIQEMITEFEEKQISALELLEGLCRYKTWFLEIDRLEMGGYTPRVYEDSNGELFLAIFSSKSSFKNFALVHKLVFDENYLVSLSGYWLFQNLPKGIEYLSIDSEEEHNINYKKTQFELIQETAKLVEIDLPILEWQASLHSKPIQADEVKKIFLNQKYFIVKQGTEFPLAPDKTNRKLFPIFHTSYSANRFVVYLQEKKPNFYEIYKVEAERLFESFKEMELDGFVLNPLGPITPRAFHKDLLKYLV